MISRGLNAFFILVLLACPTLCTAGAPCCSAERAVQHCCEHCTANAPPAQTTPHSRDSQHHPEKSRIPDGCQCICGGALQGKVVQLDLAPHASPWQAIAAASANHARPAECGALRETLFPDVGWYPSGRELCCLHMSFLC